MQHTLRIFLFLFYFPIGLLLGSGTVLWWAIAPISPNADTRVIIIEEGASSSDIARQLHKEGVIRSSGAFLTLAALTDSATKFQSGMHEISLRFTTIEIIHALTLPPLQKDIWITIPEGFVVAEIDERLADTNLLPRGGFVNARIDMALYPLIASSMNSASPPKTLLITELEGYLFPDTYRFKEKSSAQDIADKFLINFEKKIGPQLQEEITRQKKSLREILVMASLLEREVRTDADKRIVSGILWKRLRAGMLLQVDATILYAKSQISNLKSNGKTLTFDDLHIDSPYNTYKHLGLPPGPIANPGLASIEAATHPEETDFWFYLSRPDGETVFSKTFQEHRKAIETYLR